MIKTKKLIFLLVMFFTLMSGLYAQTEFPAGDFWSLNAGVGMSGILVDGVSFQGVLEPQLWLSPPLMVGSRLGVNYSAESDSSNIFTFEGQVYLRWNFLRLGKNPEKQTNIFIQGGLGLISAYRGDTKNPFDDVTRTRGSVLADAALGVTIPLTSRWHIEPSVRSGYPHLYGFSLTAGYKFPLPQKTKYQTVTSTKTEYVEVIKMLPPEEIIRRIMISSVEYILFGPDIGKYDVGIDHDAQQLNEIVLDAIAKQLKENSDLRVRVEGHANPVTTDPNEADELMALSVLRSNAVAEQLRKRGVSDEQMVIISFGGTRTIAPPEHEIWNRNRRVELIVIMVDIN
jgi:hypothetical protein